MSDRTKRDDTVCDTQNDTAGANLIVTDAQPFFDANKRTAAHAALAFLYMNGYDYDEDFYEELADRVLELVKRSQFLYTSFHGSDSRFLNFRRNIMHDNMEGIMKKIIVVALMMMVCGSALQQTTDKANATPPVERSSSSEIVYEGGDGSSIEKAVVIKGAPNSAVGIRAESKWVRKNHPGWKKGRQELMSEKGKLYDRIDYATPDGQTKTIFFDITDFFGKL